MDLHIIILAGENKNHALKRKNVIDLWLIIFYWHRNMKTNKKNRHLLVFWNILFISYHNSFTWIALKPTFCENKENKYPINSVSNLIKMNVFSSYFHLIKVYISVRIYIEFLLFLFLITLEEEIKKNGEVGEKTQQLSALAVLFRRLGCNYQYPHGSSKASVTPVSENLMPSSGFLEKLADMWYIHTSKTFVCKI